jgi:hypothetical protein
MLVRRTLFAFLVTFACALAVFSLPRFLSNTILGATTQSQSRDTVPAATTTQAPTAPPVVVAPRSLASRLRGVFGMFALLAIGFALSSNRKRISWRIVAWGLGLQAVFAVFVLRVPLGQQIFSALGTAATWLLSFSYAGSSISGSNTRNLAWSSPSRSCRPSSSFRRCSRSCTTSASCRSWSKHSRS